MKEPVKKILFGFLATAKNIPGTLWSQIDKPFKVCIYC